MNTDIKALQKIIADENLPAEQRKAAAEHIIALTQLSGSGSPGTPAQLQQNKTGPYTDDDSRIKASLDRVLGDDSIRLKQYIATHKKCAVCLRHHSTNATKCELCGTEDGDWLPVTTMRPSWERYSKEHLSNVPTYAGSFDVHRLKFIMNMREGDGHRQVNAAKFVPTSYILSDELRDWCRQILKWIGVPESDEPKPAQDSSTAPVPVQVADSDTSELPPEQQKPSLSPDLFWEFQQWRVENKNGTFAQFLTEKRS